MPHRQPPPVNPVLLSPTTIPSALESTRRLRSRGLASPPFTPPRQSQDLSLSTPLPASSPLPNLTPSPSNLSINTPLPPSSPLPNLTPSPASPPTRPSSRIPSPDSDSPLAAHTSRFPVPPHQLSRISRQLFSSMSTTQMAQVSQTSPTHAPILSEGVLTYAVIIRFEQMAKRYFANKPITPENRVARIIYNFESPLIQSWLESDLVRFCTLTFDAFMDELKKKWLPRDWEDAIVDKVIAVQGTTPFFQWVVDLRRCNSLLEGKTSQISDTQLKAHIVARLDPALRSSYRFTDRQNVLTNMVDIEAWIEEVRHLEDDLNARCSETSQQWVTDLIKSTLNSQAATTPTPPPPANPPGPFTGTGAIPRLTQDEKTLLAAHGGCFKCRLFYAGHYADTCSVNRPSPEAVANLNATNAAIAKAARTRTTPAVVAAIFGHGPATFTDPNNEQPGSDDSGPSDYADEYVSMFTDSLPEHIWWECCIDAPLTCAPTPIRALIDSGASPALISSETAELYGLVPRKLHRPYHVSGAFTNSKDRTSTHSLDTFFTQIVLGLDFLIRNKIVLDPEARTAIAKESQFDLLNPGDPTLSRIIPVLSPPQRRKVELSQARKEASLIHDARKRTRLLRIQTHNELASFFAKHPDRFNLSAYTTGHPNIIALVKARIQQLASLDTLSALDHEFKTSFHDCFPKDIPHVRDLPSTVYHNIEVPPNATFATARAYSCPRKYRDGWKTLIDQHVAAGRIRPSSSPFTSPSFIVPKSDPNVLPRWVNDFRVLNKITTPDNYPLPRVEDILADCAKGVIWGKIDMTNSFFQTLMNPDHIKYTATLTPFGLWEWVVMPMGLRNSPATHQRRVTLALREHIGRICHVYLDDIIIWSSSLEEHKTNVARILESLRVANLFCSLKKSTLFATEIDFLGHHISAKGIEADLSKVERIINWPRPRNAKDVRRFLGLVRYLSAFLPALAEQTAILTPLTKKDCNTVFPTWSRQHQFAFDAIKSLVISRECLTTIDHVNPGDNKIFVTCDASQRRTGAVLSFGPSWERARPVAFESRQLRGPELHYPVHEQEMLAIMRAVTKWRTDLLGSHIHIYTDHKTLENFDHQKDLSRRQARWMEYLSQYEYSINYISGDLNTVADALSRLPDSIDTPSFPVVCPVFEIRSDPSILADIKEGYSSDTWCKSLITDLEKGLVDTKLEISLSDGLLFIGQRLIIPRFKDLRENLFRLAHDNLGHFGGNKTYLTLRDDFYWPNMRRDLTQAYVPSCPECQRNKSRTTKPPGPLHPLPVPDKRFQSVTLDFVGPLPKDDGFDQIVTFTDRMGADLQIVPCSTSITAEQFAVIFFNRWVCENGMPDEIITDRDKLFMSRFWKSLMRLSGIRHKFSTSYHPQTDGSSERSNKTVIQCLRFHVERKQTGWARSLPKVRFDIMNTINSSTGFSGFMLKSGFSPRIIPPLLLPTDIPSIIVTPPDDETPPLDTAAAKSFIDDLTTDFLDAHDSLIAAKISQAHYANHDRALDPHFQIGDKVLLATAHRRRDYMQAKDGRVAKFMPRFDGPYEITRAYPESSLYTLHLPESTHIHPSFHSSQLRKYTENDNILFPARTLPRPGPVVTADGASEYFIEKIIDERPRGRGKQYLVRWMGYAADSDLWLPRSELKDTTALDLWEAAQSSEALSP
ncbi:Transposon Tf2-9 polyprotein [Hypsizygus marmoreus]|uniref:Transposon Tf2-9 polyprotein n=1 Tax=Hypsizygus marmoreus TaxID=39966 RepID=A0A369JS56_HYPMA|nr:Transposon Tf2-9 polyprotein [Hypsizygus marmoreus]